MLADKKQSSRLRAYRYLLRLLPFDFQREYGSGMEEVFGEESAAVEHGKEGHWMALWWRTVRGMTRIAISEHLDSFSGDLKHGIRTLAHSPGFTAVAIIMLALGIGVNAAVFRVTNAVLFKGFPLVERNDRLMYIANGYGCCVSWPDFQDWQAEAKSFEGMAVVQGTSVLLSDKSGFSESAFATGVTPNTFKLVGQRPLLGRDFLPSDGIPGATPVAILRYGFWESQFGKNPAIVGQTVRLNDIPTLVIGVMPDGFSFPQTQDLWVPLLPTPDLLRRDRRVLWCAVGRLADGVTVESARAEMETIGHRLQIAYPDTNRDQLPIVQSFDQFFVGKDAGVIYGSLWFAVSCVLLIACANLANLSLARAIGRTREVSVRIALGAGRWRIIRQLLIESMIISAAGGVIGWWIAEWGVRAYELTGRSWRVLDYTADSSVFIYLIAVSITTGLLFGLAPAIRLSKLDVQTALKDGGRGATGGGSGKHLSSVLVSAEMALAIVLLAAAGLMIRSFVKLYTADLGIKTANVLQMNLSLPATRYPGPEAQISFLDQLKTRLEALPGVESVALANTLPANNAIRLPYEFSGDSPVDEQRRPTLFAMIVSPAYFRTLGATVRSGRDFNDTDGVSGFPVVIVNERFAAQYWPMENPLGKRLRVYKGTTPEEWLTVVGVVSNIVQNSTAQPAFEPLIYLPYRQRPIADVRVFALTHVPPESLGTAFRHELHELDPNLPVSNLSSLTQWFKWSYLDRSVVTVMFLIFAAIALLLSSLGLYAVIAHSVSLRTQEIGIRMAIGATTRDIRTLIFKQGMLPLVTGLAIGITASFAVNGVLRSVLVQISPTDPVSLLMASTVLVLAAALGCWIPARRAMRVDPVIALRHE